MVSNINKALHSFSNEYKVRTINNEYLLELFLVDDHYDTITNTAIETVELFGLTLRHITIKNNSPVARFDFNE